MSQSSGPALSPGMGIRRPSRVARMGHPAWGGWMGVPPYTREPAATRTWKATMHHVPLPRLPPHCRSGRLPRHVDRECVRARTGRRSGRATRPDTSGLGPSHRSAEHLRGARSPRRRIRGGSCRRPTSRPRPLRARRALDGWHSGSAPRGCACRASRARSHDGGRRSSC